MRSELAFDRFHERGDRIYRVLQALPFDEEERPWAQTSPLLAGAMEGVAARRRAGPSGCTSRTES